MLEMGLRDATSQAYLEIDRATALALACAAAAGGMLVGADDVILEAIRRLEQVSSSALETEDGQHWWLAKRLVAVTTHMRNSSMHRLLAAADVPVTYRNAL